MDLNALKAFVRTVERGSVTGAARDLGLSQPAVTKHLRTLEHKVSARLFERTSRSIRPTSQGLAFYEASRAAIAALEAALEGVKHNEGAIDGTLRMFAPSCLGSRQLYDAVEAFQTAHPGVTVELVLDMRPVDLVYENFDLAISYVKPETQDTIVRRLGAIRRIVVAAPSFFAAAGSVCDPQDLSRSRVVATPAVLSPRGHLTLIRRGEATDIVLRPALTTNSPEILLRALRAGHHAGPVQALLVADDLATGALVRLLPDYEVKTNDIYLSYPSTRFMRPTVRAFVDFLVPRLKAVDGID